MKSAIMLDLIYAIGILLVSLLILLIPLKVLGLLTTPFSFKTFGIRRIKRWHSHTDTLGNLMIWISVIFAFAAPWIPYYPLIFALWLTLTWLCTLARAVRLSEVKSHWKKRLVIFVINLIYGFGLLGGLGCFSYFSLPIRSFIFANEIAAGEGTNIMYYLLSPQPAAYLLNSILLMLPAVCLWSQFKYMRLENTYKGRNLFTYCLKYFIVLCIIIGISLVGQRAIEKIYQVDGESRISSSNTMLPLTREDVLEEETEQTEEQTDNQEADGADQTGADMNAQNPDESGEASNEQNTQPENPDPAADPAEAVESVPLIAPVGESAEDQAGQ